MNAKVLSLLLLLMAILGCSNSSDHQIRVRVIDGSGNAIANAIVVVGNQDGEVHTYATTDNTGELVFTPAPEVSTVTAAFSCFSSASNRTYYFVDSIYKVTGSAITLTLSTCSSTIASVNINVTNTVSGIVSSDITLGPITYAGPSASLSISGAVQNDGNISVFATGYDGNGNTLGYGYAVDRPATDGSTIAVDINRTDLAQQAHSLFNLPSNTLSYYMYASLIRKHGATNLPYNFTFGSTPVPATVNMYSADSFGDNNMIGVTVSQDLDSDGNPDADTGFVRHIYPAADQIFDFSLTPSIPTTLDYVQGMLERPTISWSNQDPDATISTLSFQYVVSTPVKRSYYYSLTTPAATNSVIYPELPDNLAAFRPAAYDTLTLQTVKFDNLLPYSDYLKAIDEHQGHSEDITRFSRYGYASVSVTP